MRGILELLIRSGANLEAKGRFEQSFDKTVSTASTPLHIAAGRGYKSVVELLIESKADINAKNGQGQTPLHIAAAFGHDSVVELLLARGADIGAKDGNARTPLHLAAAKQLSTAKLLLQHGADVNAAGPSKFTPLFEAVQGNQVDIVQLLLADKANVNAAGGGGETPLSVAVAEAKSPELAEILLNAGADVNARNPNSFSVINAAVSVASVPLVRAVLKFKPNLEVRDGNGATPLLRAADIGSNEMVKLLLEAGADPNSVNPHSGWTSLHLAAANGRVEIAQLLLAHKADPNIPDTSGRLAFDMVQAPPANYAPVPGLQQFATPVGGVATIPGAIPSRPIRPGVPVGGSPSAAASAGPQDLRELLLKHGADTNITRRGIIAISRNDYHRPMFTRSYTPHSRFTLFDLIARFYDPGRQAGSDLVFPDLSRVTLHRLETNGPGKELQINVAALFREGDCSKNLWLEWGDVVNVPEVEHPLGGSWQGFDAGVVDTLTNCLRRLVFIKVKGQTNELTLAPKRGGSSGASWKPAETDFWLSKHIFRSNLLLSTSDLTRIKVYRMDPITKEKLELTFDLTRSPMPSDLWLLDGDVIEVPEKPAATAKANQP